MEPGKYDARVQVVKGIIDGMVGVGHYSKLDEHYHFNHNACWYLPGCWRSDQGLRNDLQLVTLVAQKEIHMLMAAIDGAASKDIAEAKTALQQIKRHTEEACSQFCENSPLTLGLKAYEERQFQLLITLVKEALKGASVLEKKLLPPPASVVTTAAVVPESGSIKSSKVEASPSAEPTSKLVQVDMPTSISIKQDLCLKPASRPKSW
jgi:hypothetical protein